MPALINTEPRETNEETSHHDEPEKAPRPYTPTEMPTWDYNGDICITGVAGKFPESNNIDEFKDNLYNNVDMVTADDRRWPLGLYTLPHRSGKIPVLDKCDIGYFGVHPKQANHMDPMIRILLELTYEAIIDAGWNPEELRGKRIACMVGPGLSETNESLAYDHEKINGYGLVGCCNNMFANRLAYVFDFQGPSCVVDTACSAAMMSLDQCILNIRAGRCDAAIVGGATLTLKPQSTLQFHRFSMLSKDGASKTWDSRANGYARSEAVSVMFIQKASDARRKYASIVHCKTNTDGWKSEGITVPSGERQRELLEDVYNECKINPHDVSYVEAHGTGTPVGDPLEMNGIAKVFCGNGRKEPLLVGSVKSNMGHSETASGLCAIAKVLIAMENEKLPANLHFETPNPKIPSLFDGTVKVVDKNTPWKGGYAGISCFGFGGVNVHALLKSNEKPKVTSVPPTQHARLFQYCGRTESAVNKMLTYLEEHPTEYELYHLLSKSSFQGNTSMPYRGYTLLGAKTPTREVQKLNPEKRPIWYVFTGMGSQWSGMAKDLMKIKPFAESIEKSHKLLEQFGVDLKTIITTATEKTFDIILHSFVAIASVQVALVDTLTFFGVQPDGIVGHSVGELGCAYADGCFTAEQMVLAAYYRGKCVVDASLPPGAMAAVGLSWEEAKQRCPEGVVAACYNAEDSVTVSGHQAPVRAFVEQLKNEGIFAKEVQSSGIGFHSFFMAGIAKDLHKCLEQIIPDPKPRTSRWISSSIPEAEWDTPLGQTCSSDYHVNNLTSPVLFHEALQHVPKNAIVVEIAPHCLLQAILKRSLGPNSINIGLAKRNVDDNSEFFLQAIGRLYAAGANPECTKLYPNEVTFPIGRGVPMVSPLVEWDHSQSYYVPELKFFTGGDQGGAAVVEVDVSKEDSKDYHLVGHTIDGRVLFPATGYLCLAWKTLAKIRGVEYDTLPVTFENVQLHRATILPKTGSVKFSIAIFENSGDFEITESGSVVVSGKIHSPEEHTLQLADTVRQTVTAENEKNKTTEFTLNKSDFYKELRLRGYHYHTSFQGVEESNSRGTLGRLNWPVDFVEFLDYHLQFAILSKPTRSLYLPTRLQCVRINPQRHFEEAAKLKEGEGFPVYFDSTLNTVTSGGIEIIGMKASIAPRRQGAQTASLEEYTFVPFQQNNTTKGKHTKLSNYSDYITAYLQHKTKTTASKSEFIQTLANFVKNEKTTKTFSQQETEHYTKDFEFNCGLLEFFEHLFSLGATNNNYDQNVRNTAQTNKHLLYKDDLFNATWDEHFLRPLVDTVIENCNALKIKVVQAGASHDNVLEEIVQLFNRTVMIQVDAHATDANTTQVDAEHCEGYGATVSKWDFVNQTTSDKTLNNAHFVAVAHALSECQEQTQLNQAVENVTAAIKEGGFALFAERTQNTFTAALAQFLNNGHTKTQSETHLEAAFKNAGLEVVAKKNDGFSTTCWLCHKVNKTTELNAVVIQVDENNYNYVEELKETLANHEGRVYLVANNKQNNNGIVGLVNCLRREPNGEKIRYIFDTTKSGITTATLEKEYPEITAKDLVANVFNAETKQWGAYHHIRLSTNADDNAEETEHAFVNVLTRGDLSSLRWIESSIKHFNPKTAKKNEQLCHVYYAPLNFRDIMLASGKLPPDALPGNLAGQDCILGLEFAGRDATGKRVMGLVAAKGLATTVVMDNTDFLWPIPDNWTMEQASTVPVCYATAYYALCVRGGLAKGESVLIHSGSGAVGQAAIAIALSYGCTVFTTVGSKDKRDYLKQRFPQLKDNNFANSRDTTFEQHIMRQTNGQGVNLVLNSLAEEKLQASVRCLSQHGRFLEIGKYDLSNNNSLGMAVFLKNVAFHGILLDALFDANETSIAKTQTVKLVTEGIKSGVVQPLNATIYGKDELEPAFRFMATGKHIGKVVIKVRDEEQKKDTKLNTIRVNAVPRVECNPSHSYVITGGLGGFGMELTQFLVERGAKHIVLTGRSGVTTGYQKLCIKRWTEQGINIVISKQDTKTLAGAEKLCTDTNKHAPIGGIFNLAMVLKDAFFENQTVENFEAVCTPKVAAMKNLDAATRKHCPELKWFVAFSSISCGYGNAGQSNYGYANSVMERVCEQRKREGFPGLAIQWGAIGDVGVVSERMGGDDTEVGGTLPQRMISCMEVLDNFLNQPKHAVLTSFVMASKAGNKKDGAKKLNLVDSIANILGVKDATALNPDLTLAELGMDSLMGVEVKQTLERDWELMLGMNEIRSLTVHKLRAIGDGQTAELDTGKTTDAKTDTKTATTNGTTNGHSGHDELIMPKPHSKYVLTQLVPKQVLVKLNKVDTGRPVFIIHPIEGNTSMLETLAANVNYPVYGLNCAASVPTESMESIAEHYIKHIEKTQPQGPYFIAGYSFGAGLAFEICTQLQKKHNNPDVVGKLIMLDGSHFYVSAHTTSYTDKYDIKSFKAEGETDRLCLFISLFTLFDFTKVRPEMVKLPTFEARLAFTADIILAAKKVQTTREDIETEARLFCDRMAAAHFYKASEKFKGDIHLIRTKDNRAAETLGEDYGLHKVCDGHVSMVMTDGNHDNCIFGSNVTKTSKLFQNALDKK